MVQPKTTKYVHKIIFVTLKYGYNLTSIGKIGVNNDNFTFILLLVLFTVFNES